MTKNFLFIAGAVILTGCSESGSDVEVAKKMISNFDFESPNQPRIGPFSNWTLSINTFTQKIPSQDIEDLYHQTAAKMESLYPGELSTVTWTDQMGYPRQASFVQLTAGDDPYGFLVTTAFENNDNDSFSFFTGEGEFVLPPGAKKKPTHTVEGFLRCNHSP